MDKRNGHTSGTIIAFLASTGLASGTDPSGQAFTNLPWSVNADGTLKIDNITLKIVGGSTNAWSVTYINSKYFGTPTPLGPITLTIY
jgi:hypothetical protein